MRKLWLVDGDELVADAVYEIAKSRTKKAYALVRRHRGPAADNVAVAALILLGRLRRADRRLRRADPESVNDALVAALLLLRGRTEDARELLDGYPAGAVVGLGAQVVTTVARRRGIDVEELLDLSDWRTVNGVGLALLTEGAYAEALEWYSRGDHLTHAYNAACAAALMGDADLAVRLLATTVDRGLDDPESVDTDEDLAPLRAHPDWPALRARLGGPPASR